MRFASRASAGLPRISLPTSTTVSAAMITADWCARRSESAAFSSLAAATRCTYPCADSLVWRVSSTSALKTVNSMPALRRISARRGEAEARTTSSIQTVYKRGAGVGQRQRQRHTPLRVGCRQAESLSHSSDDYGFLVFAEGAAEGVGDFTDGDVGFDGG